MGKTNDASGELNSNELDAVTGGYVYDATYVVGVSSRLKRMALFEADTSCDWMKRIACCQASTRLTQGVRFRSHEGVL
jgi:hypothetical protein